MKRKRYIIGIDEVGRGSLAGPVYVAAICVPSRYRIRAAQRNLPLRDSKKMTPRQRNIWVRWARQTEHVLSSTSYATNRTIDRINVSQAANRAAQSAYHRLIKANPHLRTATLTVITDGGLHLPMHIPHTSIIRGDEQYPAIALASIIAKVTRDKRMEREHKKYPSYAFSRHKGYGTQLHRKILKRRGPTDIHRLTFIKKLTSARTLV